MVACNPEGVGCLRLAYAREGWLGGKREAPGEISESLKISFFYAPLIFLEESEEQLKRRIGPRFLRLRMSCFLHDRSFPQVGLPIKEESLVRT